MFNPHPASHEAGWLNLLVEEALAYNADLRVAGARVEQAAGYASVAAAGMYPAVNLLARGGGKMSGDNSGLQGFALSAGWELDVWGRVRYGRAAGEAQYASALAEANGAGGPRISTPGSRVSAWVVPTNEELMIARHTRALLDAASS